MRGKIEKLESFDLHLQSRKKNEAKHTKGKRKLTKKKKLNKKEKHRKKTTKKKKTRVKLKRDERKKT